MHREAISIGSLCFSYKRNINFINKLSLIVKTGSIFCLIGPNGAGKTTLLKLISGLLKPKAGTITINDMNYSDKREEILKRMFVSIDSPAFYSNLNSYENLKIVCRYRGIDSRNIESVLKLFSLENYGKKYKKYSNGMKQRLCLAAGFLFKPEIMILDEPFTSLDTEGILLLRREIINLNEIENTTILISSHLLRESAAFCDNYGIIDNGKIVCSGETGDDIDYLEKKYREVFSRGRYE